MVSWVGHVLNSLDNSDGIARGRPYLVDCKKNTCSPQVDIQDIPSIFPAVLQGYCGIAWSRSVLSRFADGALSFLSVVSPACCRKC